MQDHHGTVPAQPHDYVDRVLLQALQEAHEEEAAAALSDALDGRQSYVASLQDGREMAVQGEEKHAGRPQGQRGPVGRPPEPPGQPVVLQQHRQDRQRRRLGGGPAQVQGSVRRAGGETAGREQGIDGDESDGSLGGVVERHREIGIARGLKKCKKGREEQSPKITRQPAICSCHGGEVAEGRPCVFLFPQLNAHPNMRLSARLIFVHTQGKARGGPCQYLSLSLFFFNKRLVRLRLACTVIS